MKLPIITWGQVLPQPPYLLRVPWGHLPPFVEELHRAGGKPAGMIPPFAWSDLGYTARTMAVVRDFFPLFPTYAPVPPNDPRPFLRAAKMARFHHFVVPWRAPWPHFYQEIHDLLEGQTVHVAGGDPQRDEWTWSEEGLI